MQQQTQRQSLEELLANLEFKQRVLQRKIVRTQVQLELLNQRERNSRNNPYNNYHNQRNTITQQTNNNTSSSNNDNTNNRENNQSSENSVADKEEDDSEEDDSDEDSDGLEPFRLPDGSPVYAGDSVRLLNPTTDDEQEGIVIGNTPKRLKIKLPNRLIVLRQPDNLVRSP